MSKPPPPLRRRLKSLIDKAVAERVRIASAPAYSARGQSCAQCGRSAWHVSGVPYCLSHDQDTHAYASGTWEYFGGIVSKILAPVGSASGRRDTLGRRIPSRLSGGAL